MAINPMRTPPSVCSLIVFCAAVLLGTDAAAQTCDRAAKVDTPAAAVAQVQAFEGRDCLGSATCDSAICNEINPVLQAKAPTPAEVSGALRRVSEAAGHQGTEQGRLLLTRMGLALDEYLRDRKAAASAWSIEDFAYFANEPYAIDIIAWVNGCQGEAGCTETSARAAEVIELATLFRRILNKANETDRNVFVAQLEQLDIRWRAYLGSSRGQYPWELLVNSLAYRKTAQFDAPPTSQWIFAHPGAAYEVTRNAPDRQPSESLLIEMAGVYRWNWVENKMSQRWGGSVTLAWRDAGEGRQKLGYGVLAYLPRQSTVGYVWRPQEGSDEHSLVLSADLVKFLRGTQGFKERLLGAR